MIPGQATPGSIIITFFLPYPGKSMTKHTQIQALLIHFHFCKLIHERSEQSVAALLRISMSK
jgi:hypothetical protein